MTTGEVLSQQSSFIRIRVPASKQEAADNWVRAEIGPTYRESLKERTRVWMHRRLFDRTLAGRGRPGVDDVAHFFYFRDAAFAAQFRRRWVEVKKI